MVKSKKMSKSAIAIIVLALLLVLSMVLGLTGAWFTDSKNSGSQTVSFGTIHIADDSSLSAAIYRASGDAASASNGGAQLMPGDTLKFSGLLSNEGQKAYVMVKVSYSVADADDTAYTLTEADLALISLGEISGTQSDETTDYSWTELDEDGTNAHAKYTVVAEGEEINYLLVVEVDEAVANKFQGKKITVAVEFYAIQFANYDSAEMQDAYDAASVAGFARTELTAWAGE